MKKKPKIPRAVIGTVLDFMRYAVRYFISTQQYFEWR